MRLRSGSSLQAKITLSLLGVVVLASLGSWLIGGNLIDRYIVQQAHENVAKSVEMFEGLYAEKLYVKHRLLGSLASFSAFQEDVARANRPAIEKVLRDLRRGSQFDILNVTDATGRVLVRSTHPSRHGDAVANDPYVRKAILSREPCFGFDIMDRAALLREGRALAERASIEVVPTERSREPGKKLETRGLFLKAASPVLREGKLVGVVYGALLLNRDTEIPDRAKHLVFGDEKVGGREIGSATLFMDDLRISTNVRNSGGERAIGTLVSREVYQQVFERGQAWRDKAFVLDRWYLATYKPIRNLEGTTIGIIYAGILQEKYDRIRNRAVLALLLISGVSACVAILLASSLVHHFIRPVRALEAAAGEISEGRYVKVAVTSSDEMGYLGRVFNKMVDALAEKDRRLMEHVEEQILHSEKLASLGRLSSGIAHEINNPLTGILAYSGALLEDLEGTPHEEDLRVIQEETLRCREIVKAVLEFARETKLHIVKADLNQIIRSVLVILEKHVKFQNIRIVRELEAALPACDVDINQFKSVVHNLALNAADAMPEGGELRIMTRWNPGLGLVILRVIDTGVGISEENLPKVLEPFFTTKETGKGTGLGLSITYGIIKRHNGSIDISSKLGEGTAIEVRLPARAAEEAV